MQDIVQLLERELVVKVISILQQNSLVPSNTTDPVINI
jgi:hypothetical protein